MSAARRMLAAALLAATLPVAHAAADVAGPDDSIATAFGPMVPGTPYSGTFKSDIDVDYLAFDVATAGQTLHFDVANTVRGCTSLNLTGCPVYATLIDGGGHQVGGEGSSAGTGAVSESSPADVIDWTFEAAGRYYVAMDSAGDGPTYTLQYRVVTAPGSGLPPAGTGSAAPIVSLRVAPSQHGPTVVTRLRVGRALRKLTVRLERSGAPRAAPPLAAVRLSAVPAGPRTVRLRLDAATRRTLADRGRLTLRLRVVAVPVSGAPQTVLRSVRLVRR